MTGSPSDEKFVLSFSDDLNIGKQKDFFATPLRMGRFWCRTCLSLGKDIWVGVVQLTIDYLAVISQQLSSICICTSHISDIEVGTYLVLPMLTF